MAPTPFQWTETGFLSKKMAKYGSSEMAKIKYLKIFKLPLITWKVPITRANATRTTVIATEDAVLPATIKPGKNILKINNKSPNLLTLETTYLPT